jgi:hypothetical protein
MSHAVIEGHVPLVWALSGTWRHPAVYETVTKRVQASDGHMEWRAVLCETNATPGLVTRL